MVMSFTEGRETEMMVVLGYPCHVRLPRDAFEISMGEMRCLVGSWICRSGIGRWFRLETNI